MKVHSVKPVRQIGKLQWRYCLKEKLRFAGHLSSHFLFFPSLPIIAFIKVQSKPDLEE